MMQVLVTGATGFIGRHLVGRLVSDGHRVRALVRQGTEADWADPLGIEVVRGDLCDPAAVEKAATNCRLIFHLAAKTESLGLLTRDDVEAANVHGTEQVVQAAKRAGVERLVFCSSVAVYGRVAKDRILNEDTETNPDSPYGESKVRGEQIVLSARQREGLSVVIARISTVWGPGNVSWLGLFRSIASGRFRLIGSGANRHHLADVSDVVEGLVSCGWANEADGHTYILSGPESVPLKTLVELVGEEVGVRDFQAPFPAAPLQIYRVLDGIAVSLIGRKLPRADRLALFLGDRTFDLSRARRELGYVPRIHPRETIHRMAEWYRAQGILPRVKGSHCGEKELIS